MKNKIFTDCSFGLTLFVVLVSNQSLVCLRNLGVFFLKKFMTCTHVPLDGAVKPRFLFYKLLNEAVLLGTNFLFLSKKSQRNKCS